MISFLNARLFSLALVALIATNSVHAHFLEAVAILNGNGVGTNSTGTGFVSLQMNLDLVEMRLTGNFDELSSNSLSAAILIPTPPNAIGEIVPHTALLTFPSNVTTGTFDITLDLTVASSYNPDLLLIFGPVPNDGEPDYRINDALREMHEAVESNEAVFRISSALFANGEIGGSLTVVPEPTTVTLFGLTAIGLIARRARKSDRR